MEWLNIVLIIVAMLIELIVGYVWGVNRTLNKIRPVGSINIAHDTDGEKYTSLCLNRERSAFLDDETVEYIILATKHIYSEEKEHGC